MSRLKQIGQWFDERLQLSGPIREAMTHHVPRSSASWLYVFGSAALTIFCLQVVTGILLAFTTTSRWAGIYGRSMAGVPISWWRWC